VTPDRELASMLTAAINLVTAPATHNGDVVRLGNARYRLITERYQALGWIVVLKQEGSHQPTLCEEMLKTCYGLTSREIEVARMLIDRLSNKEIAQQLNITSSTAGRHAERVLKKLGVASRRDVRRKLLEC
jgi:DNA-binding NarL/FixJ family response regulator